MVPFFSDINGLPVYQGDIVLFPYRKNRTNTYSMDYGGILDLSEADRIGVLRWDQDEHRPSTSWNYMVLHCMLVPYHMIDPDLLDHLLVETLHPLYPIVDIDRMHLRDLAARHKHNTPKAAAAVNIPHRQFEALIRDNRRPHSP